MNLVNAYDYPGREQILYDLLMERTREQSISHKVMPPWIEHVRFVQSQPYQHWYLIEVDAVVGAIYLTLDDEIGVFIFREHAGHGYGEMAITELIRKHPGPKLANVNPANTASMELFSSLGKVIQVTFVLR